MRLLSADAGGIAEAAALVRAGEVVAYPTETVYGLAADPFDETALRRLFALKGRPETNPVLLVISEAEVLARLVDEVPPPARELMARFWPGPLSLVMPALAGLSEWVTAGTGKVCVRLSASETARNLARAAGGAITSTSANRSGRPAAARVEDIGIADLAAAIDGGPLAEALPSTVYDVVSQKVLREGAIPAVLLQ